jgi:hypothetical protein
MVEGTPCRNSKLETVSKESTRLFPPYMHIGVITRVIPATNGPDWVTEYDVDFGNQVIATLYETQLGLAKSP